MTLALKCHDRCITAIINLNQAFTQWSKEHQYNFWSFIIKNRCLKTTQTCEISLNKTIK